MFRQRRRCSSRLATYEQGYDTWLTCIRLANHRGDHRANGEVWTELEARPPANDSRPPALAYSQDVDPSLPEQRDSQESATIVLP
jgi:hypothetical protein